MNRPPDQRNRRRGHAWLALLLWLAAGLAQADHKSLALYRYHYWTSDDGLPHNSVNAVAQTSNGFLWFGTFDGLARFDGARIEPVPQLHGGPFDTSVSSLAVSDDGALWVGTVDRGVSRLQRHEPPRRWSVDEGLPSNAVTALLTDSAGRLLVGTSRGAARLAGDRFQAIAGVPSVAIHDIAETADGTLWLAARDEALFRIDRDGRLERVELPGSSTGVLAPARHGGLWAASGDGLVELRADGTQRLFDSSSGLASTLIRDLRVDRLGDLWIAYEGRGVQRLRDDRFEPFDAAQGLHHRFVQTLFEDSNGALWIGTALGVGRLQDAPIALYDHTAGLAGDFVRTVLVDSIDGASWVGGDGGGLARIDVHSVGNLGPDNGLLGDTVRALAQSADGALWVAVFGEGLQRLHRGRWQQWTGADGLPSTLVRALLANGDELLIGTADRGLVRFSAGRFETFGRAQGLPSDDVRHLLRSHDGSLIVATGDAGVAWVDDRRVVRAIVTSDGLPSNRVFALHEDAARRLWIGTESGLALRDSRGTLQDMSALGPPFDGAVFGIVDDGEQGMWVSGARGLAHLPAGSIAQLPEWDRQPATAPALRRIEPSDGMAGLQINGASQPALARSADGRLWIPTAQGLAVLDPSQLSASVSLPTMQIESFRVDGIEYAFGDAAPVLEPGRNRIEIGFGGVHSQGMERTRYETRLDGLDADWRPPDAAHSVQYAALPPGDYRFRVRAVSAQGRNKGDEASLAFTIQPLLYQQRWFQWLALLLLLALVAGGVALRFAVRARRLLAERRRLEAVVEQRTGELSEALQRTQQLMQTRARFFANMSHELRTPLTAILGFTEQARITAAPALQPPLQRIERNAHLLLDLVNDVLDASQLEAGALTCESRPTEPLSVIDEVITMLGERARARGLALEVVPHWPLPARVEVDPLRLKQVLLNLVGNAIKFSQRGSVRIELGASAADGHWWFDVVDSGIGIAPEQQSRLFQPFEQADSSIMRKFGGSGLGLYISRQLVERMGGRIDAQSTPGSGSRFRVELPLPIDVEWLLSMPSVVPMPMPSPAVPALTGRVLIAEDIDDLRDLEAAMVRGVGAQVTAVANGADAVERAREQRYDLILMDIHMPVMDGRQATALLRRHYDGPIVALTADAMSDQLAGHQRAGFDSVLTKPIERARLYALLARHLPPATVAANAANEPLDALQARLSRRYAARMYHECAGLCVAIGENDDAALAAGLHRLKGSAGMFGFQRVSEAAASAEAALAAGDRAELDLALDRLFDGIRHHRRMA